MRNFLLLVALLLPLPALAQPKPVSDFPSLTVIGPIILVNVRALETPSIFNVWWNELVDCAGEAKLPDRRLDQLRFYSADAIWDADAHTSYWGLYYHAPPEIVTTHSAPPSRQRLTLLHELLHHMTGSNHEGPAFEACLPEGDYDGAGTP